MQTQLKSQHLFKNKKRNEEIKQFSQKYLNKFKPMYYVHYKSNNSQILQQLFIDASRELKTYQGN